MLFSGNYVEALTLNDAWRDALWCCAREGYTQITEKGSYEGQERKQLPYLTVRVTSPGRRPMEYLTPAGIAPTTDYGKIEDYFINYIMGDLKENNDYTYGYYIGLQYAKCVDILLQGNGNQATMTIGDKDCVELDNPPCLRAISFKPIDGRLNLACYFRSWDLFAGLPENLGGLQLLNELMAYDTRLRDGDLIAFSDGAHIYEQYYSIVNQMNVDKIGGSK